MVLNICNNNHNTKEKEGITEIFVRKYNIKSEIEFKFSKVTSCFKF